MPALLTTTTAPADRNEWRTPPDLFALLHRRYGFTVDAAASEANHLLPRYWTAQESGLRDWSGERVFCNPPYGSSDAAYPVWLRHAQGETSAFRCPFAALLVPFDPSTTVWRDVVDGYASDVLMLAGRVRFLRPDGRPDKAANFASAIVVYQPGYNHGTAYRLWSWKAEIIAYNVIEELCRAG